MYELVRHCICGTLRLALDDSPGTTINIHAHTNEILITTIRQGNIISQWFPLECSKCSMRFSTFQILKATDKPMHPITNATLGAWS